MNQKSNMDQIVGPIVGAASGDALGARHEFHPPLTDPSPLEMGSGGAFDWRKGQGTDDTEQTIVLLRELVDGHDLLDPTVLELLERYHWPGNVRELRNLVERMVIMSDDRIIRKDVPRELIGVAATPTFAPGLNKTLRDFRDDMERDYIRFKLDELDWNVSKTADVLGLERTNLHKKMRSLGISRGH